MRPEYEIYTSRVRNVTSGEALRIRLDDDLKGVVDLIAELDGDSVTGVVLEGIGRVVEDRAADPDYREALLANGSYQSLLETISYQSSVLRDKQARLSAHLTNLGFQSPDQPTP